MQLNNPASSSAVILETLPDPPIATGDCPRRARMQIDLLLLSIESIDLAASEAILLMAQELELHSVIPHRVALWRMRNSSPIRRGSQAQASMSISEAKALVIILSYLARKLTALIRQLLIAQQQLSAKGEASEYSSFLETYQERFRNHFRSRMNVQRAQGQSYTSDEQLNELALKLMGQLLFCTGTSGMQRLWISLFDGEVA